MQIIYGNKNQFNTLQAQLKSNTLPHCIILSGATGIGKKLCARSIAKHFFCDKKNSCGNCHNCRLFEAGNLPDAIEIDSSLTNTEELKETLKTFQNKTLSNCGRIVIIDNFELLNNTIYNLLLKTLEEPFANNHFFLITNSIGKLPLTIQSRAQIIHFNNLSQIELINFISDHHLENLIKFKEYVDGSPGKLIWISKNIDATTKIISYLDNFTPKNILNLSELLIEEKENLRECLELVTNHAKIQLYTSGHIKNLPILYSNQEAVLSGYLQRNINLKLLINIFVSQLATILKGNYILEQDLIQTWIN